MYLYIHPNLGFRSLRSLDPGLNLGNTLNTYPTEGSWNNAPVTTSTFEEVLAAGFKSIRIPATWAYHFVSDSPSWTVNSTWMDRAEKVVDEDLDLGFYVVLNVHHDSYLWADYTASGANVSVIEEKFGVL